MLDLASRPLPAFSTYRPSWAHLTVPERMVIVIRRQELAGEPTTEDDFLEAAETCDLSKPTLHARIGEAKRLYAERFEPAAMPALPLWQTSPAHRARRIAQGAELVQRAADEGEANTALRHADWQHAEIADLWDEVLEAAACATEQGGKERARQLRALKYPGVSIDELPHLRDTF